MNREESLKMIIELMEISEVCYFTTIDGNGYPQIRAMLNLRNTSQFPSLVPFFVKHNTDFLVYMTTNTSSGKIKQIKNNPRVSLYFSKPDRWIGVMLGGRIEIISDSKIKKLIWQDNWTMYYPRGIDDDDYTVLQLKPAILKLYHQLHVDTITIDQIN